MDKKQYQLSLIEVMVSLFILSITLSVLTSSLVKEIRIKKKITEATRESMPKIELQQNLARIFSKILPNDIQKERSNIYFDPSEENCLVIRFDNGFHQNSVLSGPVEGRITLGQNDLLLKISNLAGIESVYTLKKNVSSIKYEFLYLSSGDIKFTHIWSKKNTVNPLYIKIILNKDEEYAFWIKTTPSGITLNGS